jgi:hypothetical protein
MFVCMKQDLNPGPLHHWSSAPLLHLSYYQESTLFYTEKPHWEDAEFAQEEDGLLNILLYLTLRTLTEKILSLPRR